MSWLSAAAAAASSFVAETASKVQQTIEHERSEFATEYSRCLHSSEAPPTNKASVSSSSRSPAPADTKAQLRATLNQAKSLGAALFNPFEDQARRPVPSLGWLQPFAHVVLRGVHPQLMHESTARRGWQDSLTKAANERPERVIMLPWEQPGITDAMRVKMRSLSQVLGPPSSLLSPHSSFPPSPLLAALCSLLCFLLPVPSSLLLPPATINLESALLQAVITLHIQLHNLSICFTNIHSRGTANKGTHLTMSCGVAPHPPP